MAVSVKNRRKRKVSSPKTLDTKYMGQEPDVKVYESDTELAQDLHWYGYFNDVKDVRKWVVEYLERTRDKAAVRNFKAVEDGRVTQTVCTISYLLNRGSTLPEDVVKRHETRLDDLIEYGSTKKSTKNITTKKKVVAPKVSVHERTRQNAMDEIAKIEELLDTYYSSDYKEEFDIYSYLTGQQVKSVQTKYILEYYQPLVAEVEAVLTDEDLREGYNSMSKRQLNRHVKFMKSFGEGIQTYYDNTLQQRRSSRSTRKQKTKPAEKIVAKVQYQKRDDELKLISLDPSEVLGATEVWLYNTKYKKLQQLTTTEASGFSIKGTTINGINEKASFCKRVRKPEELVPDVVKGGKRFLNKVFTELLPTKANPIIGRLNSDTIILRVMK